MINHIYHEFLFYLIQHIYHPNSLKYI